MANPYTMSIETNEYESHQYGFHLGTDERIARELVEERFIGRINSKLPVVTIALMLDGHIVDVYDGRWANLDGYV